MSFDISFDVKIKKLNDNMKVPTRGSDEAGGYDLYAAIDKPIEIQPGATEKIGTGFAMEGIKGHIGCIFARSGLAVKQGLVPANCVGVVDSDYRGEVIVALHNQSAEPRVIEPGDRIAQLVFIPYSVAYLMAVDDLDDTDRGEGGFGSTGKK